MQSFTEYINEAACLNLPPEIKRQYSNLKTRINTWKRQGKDASTLEQELAQLIAPYQGEGIQSEPVSVVKPEPKPQTSTTTSTNVGSKISRSSLSPELRRQYDNLKTRINTWKRKGKDTTALEQELEQLLSAAQSGATQPAPSQAVPKSTSNSASSAPSQSAPQIDPTKQSAEWQEGYKAAIEAIKQAKQNGNKGGSGGGGSADDSGLEGIPMDPSDQDQDQDGSGSSGSGGGKKQSRNGSKGGEGVVRPEDCVDPTRSLKDMPGRAGGMMSKEDGDKLAQSEGYDKQGGSEDAVGREWEERAKRAASQMAGKGAGYEKLKGKLDDMYRTTKDWKKELKKIVGHSISPDDKDSRFTNKNILVSQNRIARTDKDKYDNLSSMMAWIDTSGSMSQEYLNQCLNEIYAVALAKKPLKLVVVQFDTRVADVQEFRSLQELKTKMHNYQIKGGGGTEVKPCFDMLLKDPKYSRGAQELVLIFTDGYLTQYKRNPKTMKNLCWVVVDNVGFNLQYKDVNTKCVRLKSSEFGK